MIKYHLAAILANLLSSTINAQLNTGSISGRIITSAGNPAEGVSISIVNSSKGAITGRDGSYRISKLLPGYYLFRISGVGFRSLSKQVKIFSGRNENMNFILDFIASELSHIVVIPDHEKGIKHLSSSLRTDTKISELSQNIRVVTEETISDQQIADMSEAVTRNVSGAASSADESWGNYANIIARGSTLTAFRNGMNVKSPWGPLLEDMSAVERIEFIKGPAGFMFSHGEPTGLYNIVTKKPDGVSKGEFTFSYGSFNMFRSTIDVDGKLSRNGKFLYRINGAAQHKESHRPFDFNHRYSIVPVLLYKPHHKTKITVEYAYQYMNMAMLGSSYLFSIKMGDLPRNFTMLEPNLPSTHINDHILFLTVDHQLSSFWKITSQLAYLNYKQQGSSIWPSYPDGLQLNGDLNRSIAVWDACNNTGIGNVVMSGKFKTGKIYHRFLTGIDLSSKNYWADFYQSATIAGYDENGYRTRFNIYHPVHGSLPDLDIPEFNRTIPLRSRAGGIVKESAHSVYIMDEMALFRKRLRVTVGGRFSLVTLSSFGNSSDDQAFTPRVGANVSLERNTNLYGLFDQTFAPQPGVNSNQKPFLPVTGTSFETGIKKTWHKNRWFSTLSFYQIIRNNVISFVPGNSQLGIQTGQTRTEGVELDVHGDLSKSTSVIFNYAYTTARITKDEDDTKIGEQVPGAGFPKHIGNTWMTYRLPLRYFKGAGASMGIQYKARRPHGQKDYFRADIRVFWHFSNASISLIANNVFDKYLMEGAPYEFNNDPSSTEYYFITEPGLNFRTKFALAW